MFRAAHLVLRMEIKCRAAGTPSGSAGRFSTSSPSGGQRLAGKVALITGAASRIGKATASEFIQNGAKVILTDVTDEAQIAAAVDLAVKQHGQLDVLYSNAGESGFTAQVPLDSLDLANFDRVMATNVRSAVACIKHAARVMKPRGTGCVLCTGSTTGMLSGIAALPYGLSMATVVSVVRLAAAELARSGVRVNAISPHAFPTQNQVQSLARDYPGFNKEQLERTIGEDMSQIKDVVLEPVDVARAAVYLASDEAKYVTGHNLVVDGGFTTNKQLLKKAN